jgi:hypothetical protein
MTEDTIMTIDPKPAIRIPHPLTVACYRAASLRELQVALERHQQTVADLWGDGEQAAADALKDDLCLTALPTFSVDGLSAEDPEAAVSWDDESLLIHWGGHWQVVPRLPRWEEPRPAVFRLTGP